MQKSYLLNLFRFVCLFVYKCRNILIMISNKLSIAELNGKFHYSENERWILYLCEVLTHILIDCKLFRVLELKSLKSDDDRILTKCPLRISKTIMIQIVDIYITLFTFYLCSKLLFCLFTIVRTDESGRELQTYHFFIEQMHWFTVISSIILYWLFELVFITLFLIISFLFEFSKLNYAHTCMLYILLV